MRKIDVYSKNLTDEKGKNHCLRYYITAEDVSGIPETLFFESYGLGVETENWGAAEVRGVTCMRSKIELFAAMAAAASVTPASLIDAVDEFMKM